MTHLGDRVAPLIDGQLPMDASERAMTHMAACPACQESADLERLTKQRLSSMGTPQPGAEFLQRLLALGGSDGPSVSDGPKPPQPGYLAGSAQGSPLTTARSMAGSMAGQMPPFGLSATRPPGRRPSPAESGPPGGASGRTSPSRTTSSGPSLSRSARSRLAFAAAGAACLVGVGVAGGVAASPPKPSREIPAPVDSFTVQSASTVSNPLNSRAATRFGPIGAGR